MDDGLGLELWLAGDQRAQDAIEGFGPVVLEWRVFQSLNLYEVRLYKSKSDLQSQTLILHFLKTQTDEYFPTVILYSIQERAWREGPRTLGLFGGVTSQRHESR